MPPEVRRITMGWGRRGDDTHSNIPPRALTSLADHAAPVNRRNQAESGPATSPISGQSTYLINCDYKKGYSRLLTQLLN